MNTEFFNNVAQFALVILVLSFIAGLFAAVLYLLFRRELGNVKALSVTQKGSTLDGVPFYSKKSRFIHETSYLETLATYTLTAKRKVLGPENTPIRDEIIYNSDVTISLTDENLGTIKEIRNGLNVVQAAQQLGGEWNVVRSKFEALPAYNGITPTDKLPMESNKIKEEAYVDYADTLYLNKIQPLSGSSSIDIELSAEGTLSKANPATEDTTLEKFLSFLPMDKITSQLEATPKAEEAGAGAIVADRMRRAVETFFYEFSLTVVYSLLRHILYREEMDYKQGTVLQPIELDDKNSWYRREKVTAIALEAEKPEASPAPTTPGETGEPAGKD